MIPNCLAVERRFPQRNEASSSNRGVFQEIENRGAGQQRQFKLGRPMAVLNDALERYGGLFSSFWTLLHPPRAQWREAY